MLFGWFFYVFILFLTEMSFFIYAHFPGSQLGYETSPRRTWILHVTAQTNPLPPLRFNSTIGKIKA
jgi:hypothetical protein